MGSYALLFPGQGAQYVGMGKDIYDSYKAGKEVFDEADWALGFPLSSLIFEGPEEKLRLTAYTQPSILTASIGIFRVLTEELGIDLDPAFVAGHSLGEYTALVASGALSLADGVRLVHERGLLMQEAVPEGVGAMAAILGLDDDSVREICESLDGEEVCEAANFNSPGQVVVSGHRKAVEEAVRKAKEKGAKKAVLLNLSAPFHCRLMRPVADELKKKMDRCTWSDSKWPLVANVSAKAVASGQDIKQGLYRQTYSAVLWRDSIRFMASEGVNSFVEIGPGSVLSGLAKKCVKGVRTLSLASADKLQSLVDFLCEGK